VSLGEAEVKRRGSDLTIVSYSRMVLVALDAAQQLAQEGIEVEVVDLRCLRPLDMGSVLTSVRKTHRALVVEEVWRTGGFGAEVAAQINEQAFDYLDAPVARVAGEDVPMPYSRPLEQAAIPSSGMVARAAKSLVRG
jgi:pyruvate dehydrogenase E1 component beta subunit